MSDEAPPQEPLQSTYLLVFLLSFVILIVTMFAYPLW